MGDPENANRVEDAYMNIDGHGGVGIQNVIKSKKGTKDLVKSNDVNDMNESMKGLVVVDSENGHKTDKEPSVPGIGDIV